MIKNIIKVTGLFLTLIFVSCVTNKKLTYLQQEKISSDTLRSIAPPDYKILPYDNLYIRVVTPDPKFSEMFNMISTAGGMSNISVQNADIIGYTVDGEGYIRLPYAGRIEVAGKNLRVITSEMKTLLENYIANPDVTVKILNNYVTLLGQVKAPGKYPLSTERINIFQALAMGGDLGDYSDRQVVQIIRPTTSGNIIREFSLNDRSIMTSEFYYIMPNDVIYAKPMKGRFFQFGAFPFAIITSTITTFVLIWNFVKVN